MDSDDRKPGIAASRAKQRTAKARRVEAEVVIRAEDAKAGEVPASEFTHTVASTSGASRVPEAESSTLAATERLNHELRVYQIELEMMNDELLLANSALDVSRARYLDLYERAPVAYCTLDLNGKVLEENHTTSQLLGSSRLARIGQPFTNLIFRDDQDTY